MVTLDTGLLVGLLELGELDLDVVVAGVSGCRGNWRSAVVDCTVREGRWPSEEYSLRGHLSSLLLGCRVKRRAEEDGTRGARTR